MRWSGWLVAVPLALGPAPAWALGPVELGASALFTGGYNGIDQGTPSSFTVDGQTTTYPGFGGATVGAGVALELRVLGIVGVEIDGLFARDFGSGEVTQGTTKANVTIGQRAVHIPILLKGVLPLPLIRPFVVVGPELVLPLVSKAESDPAGAVRAVVGTERYTMVTFGAGAEVKLPVPAVDLRASLSLRGSYRVGSSDDLAERATVLRSGAIILDGRWRYQALLGASVGIFF